MKLLNLIFFISISLNSFAQSQTKIVLSTNYTDVCLGEELVFTISESENGIRYYLYEQNQSDSPELIGNGRAMMFDSFKVRTGIYYLVIKENNVFVKISNDVSITTHKPLENKYLLEIDKHIICEGEEVNLSMSSFDYDVVYSLYANNIPVGNGLLSATNILQFPKQNPIESTSYTVKAQGEYCIKTVDILTKEDLFVNKLPLLNLNVSSDKYEICINEDIIVSVDNTIENVFYQLWNGKEFIEPPVVGNGEKINFSPLYLKSSSEIKVATYGSVCSERNFLDQKINIEVIDYGELPIDYIVTPEKLCDGETFSLHIISSKRNMSYILENVGVQVAKEKGNGGILRMENIHYRPNSNFEILFEVCADRKVLARPEVIHVDIPKLKYNIRDISYRDDGEISIMVNGGTPPYKFNLYPLESTITTFQDEYQFKNLHQGLYSVSVIDANNCSDIQNLNLEVKTKLEANFILNNILTPNGDGFNDVFKIECNKDIGRIELLIFNIYGQQVYFSEDYKNNWDGDGLLDGSYYYYMKFSESDIPNKKGIITILSK